jgi:hypothetical protein
MPLSHVTVRKHTHTGRYYHDVVAAESFEDALQLAAGRATAPQPRPGSEPEPDGANHRRCADVWVCSLLGCELAQGHDGPHMATARGYRRPARWVRDDRGLVHVLGEPAGPGPPGLRRTPASGELRAPGARRSLMARTWLSPHPQRVH